MTAVFVLVNALAHVVRFPVELALVFLGEVPIVSGHVFLFVILEALFAFLKMRRLAGRQLSVLDAIADTLLLVRLAPIYLVDTGVAGIDLPRSRARRVIGRCGLSSSSAHKYETGCQD